MTRLYFQPIRGKSLDIIRAILQTEEIASAGNVFGDIHLATEELVVNIVENAYPDGGNDYLGVEIMQRRWHYPALPRRRHSVQPT